MNCCSTSKENTAKKSKCCSPEKTEATMITDSKQGESSCCGEDEVEPTTSCSSTEETFISIKSNADPKQAESSCCSTESKEAMALSCSTTETVSEAQANYAADYKQIEYKVIGMDCPSCATTIEKGLQRLTEVIQAKVSYPNQKLQVAVIEGYSGMQIESTVKNLGFTIEPVHENNDTHIYDVTGMDCGSCAKSLEKHLSKLADVSDVQVNFALGSMKISHTNATKDIIKEVAKLGFEASPQASKNQAAGMSRNQKDLMKVATSGVLIATGFIGTYTGLASLASTIMFAIAIVISGYKPIKSAYYAVKSRSLDMNVLMSIAAIGAALIGEWFEGATVVWLFSLGIYLQDKSMDQTRESIRGLMDMAPSMASVKVGTEIIEKRVEDVTVGETIVIKPGDKIPLDGKILQGETSINQAPITGESLPVDKSFGDIVFAGTMNESGALEIEVTKLVKDTTLAKIIHLVEEAQDQKAPSEAFIDKFASIYTPIVFVLALSVIVIPPLLGFGVWSEWIYKGLALLVVACPCALVISTPVAIVSAIGTAARNGVLIKGGTFLEQAGIIDTVAFDKTGTLTEGKPQVSDIEPIEVTEEELLAVAHTLESHSTHPIAKTIVTYAREKGIHQKEGALFKNIVGKGVEATIDGEVYYAGNQKLFVEKKINGQKIERKLTTMQQEGKTIVIIGNSKKVLGLISVTDTIRTATVNTLDKLRNVGMKQIVMLTGDNEGTAKLIAEKTRIHRYFAELLPEDKVTSLKQLQNEGSKVAMVGDGINDAPALATADLGIAMGGTGTDTAMETADVVLMADNLEKLPYTVKLSRKALTIIKQNILFSLIIKFIALALIFPGWLTLWMAVLSDTGAAIIVILNSLRLIKK